MHVANWGVEITTPDVSSKSATVRIKTLVKNETGLLQHIILKTGLWTENAKSAGIDITIMGAWALQLSMLRKSVKWRC